MENENDVHQPQGGFLNDGKVMATYQKNPDVQEAIDCYGFVKLEYRCEMKSRSHLPS
jgi:hypothetical protein